MVAFGQTVDVDCAEVPNVVPAIKATATVGQTTIERVLTLGAVDGARKQPNAIEIQAALDAHRQAVAEEAMYLEELRKVVAQLQ